MGLEYLEKFSKNPTGEEVLYELKRFLDCTTSARATMETGKLDLADSMYIGLWLLRHLPVSRDTVFDVISVLYEDFAQRHLTILADTEQNHTDDDLNREGILNDIHSTFVFYLDSCHEIWAPILSTWSLQLLGQISSDNANRPVFTRDQSVNEVINIWMGSKSIQSLLNLTSRCVKSHTDTFISSLLDTSASHSPHFDWVVAHVGNTYPQTVVSEVLRLGLQNFSTNIHPVSTLNSVVGILGHLSTTHSKEVQQAFEQMLQTILVPTTQLGERYAMPYLLQLCSSSVPLLDVLMDSVLPKIKEDTLASVQNLVPIWIQLHFAGKIQAFVALVTHLILKSTRGPRALGILISGCKVWSEPIRFNARMLLDFVAQELSSLLYDSEFSHKDLVKNFPCITSLKENSDVLLGFLTDSDLQVCKFAMKLVKLITMYEGEATGIKAVVKYLRQGESDLELWHLLNLIGAVEMKYPNMLESAFQLIVTNSHVEDKLEPCHLRQWKNILRIIMSERLRKVHIRIKMSEVIRRNVISVTHFLDTRRFNFEMDLASYVLEILAKTPLMKSDKIRFGTLLTIERYLVELLFRVLNLSEECRGVKIKNVCHISKLIFELTATPAIQNDALRSLVQSCLNPEYRLLFQTRKKIYVGDLSVAEEFLTDNDEYRPERYSMYVSLLKENQKRPAGVSLARVNSTSFHSGKLNKGSKKSFGGLAGTNKVEIRENTDWRLNVQLFLSVLMNACTQSKSKFGDHNDHQNNLQNSDLDPEAFENVSVEAMRKVALLLVEIVSPDVMFNGLPWPEEEFSKVQVERDLQIRRAFEEHPYLWDLLELVANYSPSLCYCSVLLRALMATFMAHWISCQEAKSSLYPTQLEWTIRLVNVLRTGQLIPPPLSYIGQIMPDLKANEVLFLLKDIWWYMKVHVPVPTVFIKEPTSKRFVRNADFAKVDPVFTEKLRITLLNNVEKLGFLYPKLFPS